MFTVRKNYGYSSMLKWLGTCLEREDYLGRCLKEAISDADLRGSIPRLTALLGVALHLKPKTTLGLLMDLMSNEPSGSLSENASFLLTRLLEINLGPLGFLLKLSDSKVRLGRGMLKELMGKLSCYELEILSSRLEELGRLVNKEVAIAFVNHGLNISECPGVRGESIKIALNLFANGLLSKEGLKEVLKGKKVKVIIRRKEKRVIDLKVFLGDELISSEIPPYLLTALSLSGGEGIPLKILRNELPT